MVGKGKDRGGPGAAVSVSSKSRSQCWMRLMDWI